MSLPYQIEQIRETIKILAQEIDYLKNPEGRLCKNDLVHCVEESFYYNKNSNKKYNVTDEIEQIKSTLGILAREIEYLKHPVISSNHLRKKFHLDDYIKQLLITNR
jgi:hypothetical protein